MAILYRVYSNNGDGGAVNYATPLATTSALSVDLGPLSPSTDTTFVVRAFDPATGLEEANTDARVRLVIDAAGQDVSGRPDPPSVVTLRASAGGGARVSWAYRPSATSGAPLGFHVYLGPASSGPAATLSATVDYVPGRLGYSRVVPGPLAFGSYAVAVKAFNALGEDGGMGVVTGLVGLAAGTIQMGPVSARVIGPDLTNPSAPTS